MSAEMYRYMFKPDVALDEVESSLLLSVFAVESLHGECQVQLDAAHDFDRERRVLVVDAATEVGRDLNRVFCGFLRREFAPETFEVQRVERPVRQDLCPA